MVKLAQKTSVNGDKSLEMVMRDVMENLVGAASYFAYRTTPNTLEILSIEPPKDDPHHRPQRPVGTIAPSPSTLGNNIVVFLIRRETRLDRI